MNYKTKLFLIVCILCCNTKGWNQHNDSSISSDWYIIELKKKVANSLDTNDYTQEGILKTILNRPLFSNSMIHTINNGELNFYQRKRPAFVYFGFAYCHPCREQMPDFIALSKKYPSVDFVYISFDNEKMIREEFRELKNEQILASKNFFAVSMPEDEMIKRKLVHGGYPRKYFLNRDAILKHAVITAEIFSKEERVNLWLSSIKEISK